MKPRGSPSLRSTTLRLGSAAAFLVGAVLVQACYTGPNTDHFESVLDELALPADWQQVKTERHGPGEASDCDPAFTSLCPSVRRCYPGRGDASTALDQVRQAMTEAGFGRQDVKLPNCDGVPQANVCSVFAERGDERLAASVYLSARAAGLEGQAGEQVIVLVTASR
jgi:hypothetical protein